MIANTREDVPLDDLDLTEYVALADAGLSPYGRVLKIHCAIRMMF